uniref:Uncharacterized protein n=1 Tax=Oryza meridionalis TaxID=40149 RepID=A0A0E0DGG3_9ORYZ
MAAAASSAVLLLPNSRAPAALSRRRAPVPRRGFVVGFEGRSRRGAAGTMRACFNPLGDERILREALKVTWFGFLTFLMKLASGIRTC